jgi:dihydrofolate synthase/folylpolyglutamate synthase
MQNSPAGSPENPPWRELQVRGSLGRSSTAAMVAALLSASGQRTGLLQDGFAQSPLDHTSIEGTPLAAEEARRLLTEIEPNTAAGSRIKRVAEAWFRSAAVQWVVRTGYDSPSESMSAVIWTPVTSSGQRSAAEETERLLESTPPADAAVAAPQRESVLDRLRPAYAGLQEVAQRCALARGRSDLDGQELRLRTPLREYRLKLPLLGRHQLENAATAILAVEQLVPFGVELSAESTKTALARLRLPGRIEPIKRHPLILVDLAQTPEAMRRLAQTLHDDLGLRRPLVILAARRDLNAGALLAPLVALDPELILSQPPSGDAMDPAILALACQAAGLPMSRIAESATALDEALEGHSASAACIIGPPDFIVAARAYLLGLMPPALHFD